ncbi:hypothetical protein D3OALGA1CA_1026 [Olavius algarvensis associated proteobacterium Delta 3]|nr:hypothetical protein D3OALGA1CA_1026 [Olavius algarvensis associated proteobacterium Delta 3]CAB5130772.1 hypothetical protein D3OALGB2SA_3616 [Olavius algarvensis associated proteobacterium Delta 3]
MALPATHIRFAADMADRYPIHRLEAYISGAVYPDSRRFTGIPRKKTHAGIHLQRSFAESDFTFGWHVHCLCDHLQAGLYNRLVPGLLKLDELSRWVRLAAAKMVQDQHDMHQIDLDPLLDCLAYAQAPQGENITQINAYNRLIQDTYSGKHHLAPGDYYGLWTGVGVSSHIAEALVSEMQQILEDNALAERICSSYELMLHRGSASSRSLHQP